MRIIDPAETVALLAIIFDKLRFMCFDTLRTSITPHSRIEGRVSNAYSIIIILPALLFCATLSARDWTDRDGRIIEARLVEYSGGRVTLERTDGQIFTFSEEMLSEADRAYLSELSGREALAVDRTEVIDLRVSDPNSTPYASSSA